MGMEKGVKNTKSGNEAENILTHIKSPLFESTNGIITVITIVWQVKFCGGKMMVRQRVSVFLLWSGVDFGNRIWVG